MSNPVIKVENLSKKYVLTHQTGGQGGQGTLRDAITDGFKSVSKRFTKQSNSEDLGHEDFWALNDVSFEINQGDRVGIIGRNGAGKSTLLKILSRITEPTNGRITIQGRVASLLEVGTGFHPELTGRENIFLNGAILGMSKVEIKRKFDEIVAFSEVEKFLDTPVKRYSSGMYVRLAFAVAAHLESEILIIDEVLAVGDMAFQRKCIGKMDEVAKSGRTILFVSHTISVVENLCNKAIYLEKGRVKDAGESGPILNRYLVEDLKNIFNKDLRIRQDRSGSGSIKFTYLKVTDINGNITGTILAKEGVRIVLGYEIDPQMNPSQVNIGISFEDQSRKLLSVFYSSYVDVVFNDLNKKGEFVCEFDKLSLATGSYIIGARLFDAFGEADWPRDGVGEIYIDQGDYYGSGSNGFEGYAPLLIKGDWKVNPLS
jgi:lipopolysaccharide transport system ATP-binding protein